MSPAIKTREIFRPRVDGYGKMVSIHDVINLGLGLVGCSRRARLREPQSIHRNSVYVGNIRGGSNVGAFCRWVSFGQLLPTS